MTQLLASFLSLSLSSLSVADEWIDLDFENIEASSPFSGLFQAQVVALSDQEGEHGLGKGMLRIEYTDKNDLFKWDIHTQFNTWHASSQNAAVYGPRVPVYERYSAIAEKDYHTREGTEAELDWAYISGSFEKGSYVVGRQPITLSYGKVWSPADIYSPFNYFDLDRLYKAGVDAIKLNYYPVENVSLMTVAASIREYDIDRDIGASQSISHDVAWGRWNLMLARTVYSNSLSSAIQWNDLVFESDVYIELVYNELSQAEQEIWSREDLIYGLMGLSRKITNNSILTYEFLYQSIGTDSESYTDYLGQHLQSAIPESGLGSRYHSLSISSQITGLLMGEFLVIQNLKDSGVNISGLLKYSLSDNIEGRLGFSYAPSFNRKDAEYELYPDVIQLGINWFF